MNPINIINFIASKRPEQYSKEKIKKISNLLPSPVYNGYKDENGLQGQWERIIDKSQINDEDDDIVYHSVYSEISTYKNSIKNGPSISYYPNYKTHSRGEYINGQKNGEWITRYYNGRLKEKGEYINDQKNGIWEQYYGEYGWNSMKGEYINGQKNGIWEEYSGLTLRAKGEYLNNRKIGIWEEYDTNGDLSAKGEYLNGYQHGQWEYYHPNTNKLWKIKQY